MVQVKSVIDGDTFVTSNDERVRLIGIDAPEKNRCFYNESRNFLSSLIADNTLRIESDVDDLDQYGRKLRYVYLEDQRVNDHMVREGYALASFEQNRKYFEEITALEEEAVENSRGLWNDCDEYEYIPAVEKSHAEQNSPPKDTECLVKGNISNQGFGKKYLFPGCPNYNRTRIDTRKGERYFCTEQEAQNAGFTRAGDCPVAPYSL